MKHKKRISGGTAGLMYGTALIFDGISLVPIIGSIVPVFGSLTFWLWFKMKGVDFNSTKKMAAGATTLLVEVIPVLNLAPAWTFSTFIIIEASRAEDLLLAKKQQSLDTISKQREEAIMEEESRRGAEETLQARTLEEGVLSPQNSDYSQVDAPESANAPEEERGSETKYNVVREIRRIDYTVNPHFYRNPEKNIANEKSSDTIKKVS